MNFRPVKLLTAIMAFLCFAAIPALADDLPPPPAFAIAQRLLHESDAARDYARVLAAAGKPGPSLDSQGQDVNGNPPSDTNVASYQHHVSILRAQEAASQYNAVTTSAMYSGSSYVPVACYDEALVYLNYLHQSVTAMTMLQNLTNKYAAQATPQMLQQVAALKTQLAAQINQTNKTKFPGSILYAFMDFLVHLTGARSYSYALAILMIGVIVRLAVTPLSNKTYASMKEQQKLAPIIKEIQTKYKDDKEKLGQEITKVYTEHGVNPMSGCLPMLIQLPVFFLLMYMIRLYQYQFIHGTFLWIGSSLSKAYPAYLATNLGLNDYPLLFIYGGCMYLQQRMVTPADPQQAEQQRTMALMSPFITIYFTLQYHLPSAFVLYYIIFSLLSMTQQYFYMKKRKKEDDAVVLSTPTVLLNGKNGTNGKSPASPKTTPNGKKNEDVPITGSNDGAGKAAGGAQTPAKVYPKKKRR